MFYKQSDEFELVNLDGVSIQTTVTRKPDVVDDYMSLFLRSSSDLNNKTMVFGFDTEWHLAPFSKCAAVHICYGDQCLIIKLSSFQFIPNSLVNFLRHPNYTFVGFGIKHNVAKLERTYGFGCRNAVELGPLAATVLKKPHLSYCGVDELLFAVDQRDLREYRFHWSSIDISKEHAKSKQKEHVRNVTINVYSYHLIGTKLLAQDWEE